MYCGLKILTIALVFLAIISSTLAASGFIMVRNEGGYVALLSVDYDLNGQRKSDSGQFTAGVNKEVKIPEGARNIFVKVEEYWFISAKSTIFTKSYNEPVSKCFKIWGTTLAPHYGEISC